MMCLTINNILSVLAKQSYSCPQSDRNCLAEHTRLPHFSEAFFQCINEGWFPDCRQFLIKYIKINKVILDKLCQQSNGKLTKRDILCRAKRSYPSLVRDYHFYLLVKDHNLFDNVSQNQVDDANGIDCTITKGSNQYYIHLYVDSPNSRAFRDKKNNRHSFTGMHVDLPILLRDECKFHNFYLYNDRYIRLLANYINEIESII